jgi:hypothetical protein
MYEIASLSDWPHMVRVNRHHLWLDWRYEAAFLRDTRAICAELFGESERFGMVIMSGLLFGILLRDEQDALLLMMRLT